MHGNIKYSLFFWIVKQETQGSEPTEHHLNWYFLAGSLGAGLIVGIAVMYVIQSLRRKSRSKSRAIYEDVRSTRLELDTTSPYENMRQESSHYQEVGTSSHYAVADHAHGVYENMSQATSLGLPAGTRIPGYTDLDSRVRVDSHIYQGLELNRLPGNKA